MKWFHDFVKITAAIPLLISYRPKIRYIGKRYPIKGGALLIANHIGLTDPIYVMLGVWYRRIRFVCMKEFWDRPFMGKFLAACMCIPIDRENVSMDTFREITDSLSEDKLVAIFPGGHVDQSGNDLGEFKSGMVLMALRGGKPIIPIYLKKRAHWYNRLEIMIGEPVDIRALYGPRPKLSEINEIVTLLQENMRKMKETAGKTAK